MMNPISLEPEQYQRLQEIAQAQGSTLESTLKEVIELGLESLHDSREAQPRLDRKQRRLQALQKLAELRHELSQTSDLSSRDLIAEVREEQLRQIDPFA